MSLLKYFICDLLLYFNFKFSKRFVSFSIIVNERGLFFKISSYLALVLIGEKTLSMELTYTIIAFISAIIGWHMHNKEIDIRKKHFRVFFFYEISLILILLSF